MDAPQMTETAPAGGIAPRRRRLAGGRQIGVRVRFSDAELEQVRTAAQESGVSVSRWLADTALAASSGSAGGEALGMSVLERRAWVSELMGVRRLVSAVGNNVNQLAMVGNSSGEIPEAADATLVAARRVLARLNELLAKVER